MFKVRLLLVFMVIFLFSVAVRAQDVTPIPPDQAGQTILTAVLAIISSYGAVVGAAGAVIVGLLKFVPWLNDPNNISGATLNLVVNGVLVVALWIATHFGYALQFQTGLSTVETVGNALLAFISAVLGSALIHKVAASQAVPIVGKQREGNVSPQALLVDFPRGE